MPHEINLLFDDKIIHTVYTGVVNCAEIVDAINEWYAINTNTPGVRFVIFDYTDAEMTPFSTEEIQEMARGVKSLVELNPCLILVGALPNALEYGLSRMWVTQSCLSVDGIPEQYTQLFKTFEEALRFCHEN